MISVSSPQDEGTLSPSFQYRVALSRLTELLEVLDGPETGLAIRNSGVEKVLLARLVHREALESQVPRRSKELLHIAWFENGAGYRALLHAVLDEVKPDGDDARLVQVQCQMTVRATKKGGRGTQMITISMAPQKLISPSPWLKWRSPTENLAPGTWTGR